MPRHILWRGCGTIDSVIAILILTALAAFAVLVTVAVLVMGGGNWRGSKLITSAGFRPLTAW